MIHLSRKNVIKWIGKLSCVHAIGNPKFELFTFTMNAKKTVQPTVPIQPDFAQVAWTLLDPQGQVQKEPYFDIKIILTISKRSFCNWIRGIELWYIQIYLRKLTKRWNYFLKSLFKTNHGCLGCSLLHNAPSSNQTKQENWQSSKKFRAFMLSISLQMRADYWKFASMTVVMFNEFSWLLN